MNFYLLFRKIIISVGLHLILILLVVDIGRAQTVPGTPILWLRSDAGVVLQNNHVALWKDQSGHGNDVFMDDTNARPDLIAKDSNGYPALLFHGWNYLKGPSVFPGKHDYTIGGVVKITNANTINNIVSGNGHALWLNSDLYPRIVHFHFDYQLVGLVPLWSQGFSELTALYSESDEQAKLFTNGEFADSSWVQSMEDSTLLIGSYRGGYFLQGEIQEIVLYDRELTPVENEALGVYFRSKYRIAHTTPSPKPDSTFAHIPKSLQLYGRGADDSATVEISGAIYRAGFDSIYVNQFKNGQILNHIGQRLEFRDGNASFQLLPRIHAEFSEYRFDIHLISANRDTLIARRDSVACGDMLLMDGQGIAYPGYDTFVYANEYCRGFGIRWSNNLRDTMWSLMSGRDLGAAGQRIQQDLIERVGIPSCCISEAAGGTNIESHERLDSDRYSLQTTYGRMLYRTTESGMLQNTKVMFWLQGEANYAPGYYEKFLKLYRSWKEDFPALKKIYLLQIRPNFCDWNNIDMRDVQRAMGDSLHDVEPIASAAIPGQDGCHYYDSGYMALGDRFFASLARDFYHATDTENLRSPNAYWAYYTRPDKREIAILFSPSNAQLHSTPDTIVAGVLRKLKDYLLPDDTTAKISDISFSGDTLFVEFDQPSKATWIGYLPDQNYRDTNIIYEGPWIVNQRGYGALLWHHLTISDSPYSRVSQPPQFNLYVYPNPANNTVSINTENAEPAKITIFSEAGQAIAHYLIQGGQSTMDVSSFPAGCYLLVRQNSEGIQRQKFIIAR